MKREVNFNKYCKTCISRFCSEWDPDTPCYECLQYAWNEDSEKPQLYEEDKK